MLPLQNLFQLHFVAQLERNQPYSLPPFPPPLLILFPIRLRSSRSQFASSGPRPEYPGNADSFPAHASHHRKLEIVTSAAERLAGIAGISDATLGNSASYLQSWINRLKSDSRLIISAASHAQKAADYILGKTQAERSDRQ
jgi:hypothetical protein